MPITETPVQIQNGTQPPANPDYKTDESGVKSAVNAPATVTYWEKSVLPTDVTGFWATPVQTTNEIRTEYDNNANKLAEESEKYSYDNILTPEVTGKPTTPAPTTTTPTTPAPTETESEYTKTLRDIDTKRQSEFDKMNAADEERRKQYESMMKKSDGSHALLIENIKTQFDSTRRKMLDTNSRFNAITRQNQYLINGLRYTPQQAEGMIYDAEQAGLSRLADLDTQYADVLLKAQTAKDDKDYKNLNDLMTNLEGLANDRLAALNDMATSAKEIEQSLNTVENMNQNQMTAMNNMMEWYGIDLEWIAEKDREAFYKGKAKEISDITGTKISAEFVKSQMTRYNKSNLLEKNTPNLEMSEVFWVYTNARGEPIKTPDGKPIRYTPQDKSIFNEKTGQLTIFSRDAYGNPTEQVINVEGYTPEQTTTTPWVEMSDGSLLNKETGETKPKWSIIPGVDVIPLANDALNKYIAECRENGQCGEWVNDYLQKIWGKRIFGDGYDQDVIVDGVNRGSKTKYITPGAWPIPWAIAIWDPQSNGTGHVAVVLRDNGDGTVKVHDWNWDGKGTQKTHNVLKSQITDTGGGYHIPDSLKNTAWANYTDSDIELLAELANMDASVRNTALKAQWIPLQRVTDYMALAKAGKIPPTESQKQASLGIMSSIQGIAETDWNDATGKLDVSRLLGLQWASDTWVLIENLRDASALNNLSLLKWPMSDKDIAFLKSISSKLDPVQSNKQFEKNIVEMYNIAARKAWVKEITKLSEIPKERILPGQSMTEMPTNSSLSQEEEDILKKYDS